MNWKIIRLALHIVERAMCLIEDAIPHEEENEFTKEFASVFMQSWGRLISMIPEEEE
jgi:hypothetical protein